MSSAGNSKERISPHLVSTQVDAYNALHKEDSSTEREVEYARMVNTFYDLVTDFYEYGWGQSFHFAVRFQGESLPMAIARHEHFLALHLKIDASAKIIDIGCGVGGPMRTIARFSGAKVVGVNNNAYQIGRGEMENAKAGLDQRCSFVKADFMSIPLDAASFDGAYAIEATCHAPNPTACYAEVRRLLKPGALFCGYEWCLTSKYDPSNAEHVRVKKGIEVGNGLPDIRTTGQVDAALVAAGFELVESRDVAALDAETAPGAATWYEPLVGSGFSLTSLRSSSIGRFFTHHGVGLMEKVGLAPPGAQEVHTVLQTGADTLVESGQMEIFTPMYFFVARNPV